MKAQFITEQAIRDRLSSVINTDNGKDLISSGEVRNIKIHNDTVTIMLELGYPAESRHDALRSAVTDGLSGLGIQKLTVDISTKIVAHKVAPGMHLLGKVKNIIAVASGKGGVGKSTTSVNLALALAQEGAAVGLLDADIYGPSQPQMLGIADQKPGSPDGKHFSTLQAHGIEVMSIGFLVDVETPMIWRGPMATQALNQLMSDTLWPELDYLVVDMPPGTGDIQLTLAQKAPVTGTVIVSTPQDIALLDARKGIRMFEKVGIPILGIVENMSIHICSNCGHEEAIFGHGGAEKLCADYNTMLLGALPLDISIRSETDSGRPSVIAQPQSRIAEIYRAIARKAAAQIALTARDTTHKFPPIVFKNK